MSVLREALCFFPVNVNVNVNEETEERRANDGSPRDWAIAFPHRTSRDTVFPAQLRLRALVASAS